MFCISGREDIEGAAIFDLLRELRRSTITNDNVDLRLLPECRGDLIKRASEIGGRGNRDLGRSGRRGRAGSKQKNARGKNPNGAAFDAE